MISCPCRHPQQLKQQVQQQLTPAQMRRALITSWDLSDPLLQSTSVSSIDSLHPVTASPTTIASRADVLDDPVTSSSSSMTFDANETLAVHCTSPDPALQPKGPHAELLPSAKDGEHAKLLGQPSRQPRRQQPGLQQVWQQPPATVQPVQQLEQHQSTQGTSIRPEAHSPHAEAQAQPVDLSQWESAERRQQQQDQRSGLHNMQVGGGSGLSKIWATLASRPSSAQHGPRSQPGSIPESLRHEEQQAVSSGGAPGDPRRAFRELLRARPASAPASRLLRTEATCSSGTDPATEEATAVSATTCRHSSPGSGISQQRPAGACVTALAQVGASSEVLRWGMVPESLTSSSLTTTDDSNEFVQGLREPKLHLGAVEDRIVQASRFLTAPEDLPGRSSDVHLAAMWSKLGSAP